MNRRKFMAVGGTALFTGITGCIADATESPGNEPNRGTITVQTTGEALAEPDIAVLHIAVESVAETVSDVRDDLTTRTDTLRTALIDSGLDEDTITTARFDIRENPDYYRRREGTEDPPESIRYRGVHELTIEITDINAVGPTIDTAVDAGADRIGRIEYTVSDDKRHQLRDDALRDAINDGESEVALLTSETNTQVVGIKQIDATGTQIRPYRADVAEEQFLAGDAPPVHLDPDDVTVTATVKITYHIE